MEHFKKTEGRSFSIASLCNVWKHLWSTEASYCQKKRKKGRKERRGTSRGNLWVISRLKTLSYYSQEWSKSIMAMIKTVSLELFMTLFIQWNIKGGTLKNCSGCSFPHNDMERFKRMQQHHNSIINVVHMTHALYCKSSKPSW